MSKKVIIELTETQARIVLVAVEEWFRLRLGQRSELANGLAFFGYKHDQGNQRAFDLRICRRNAIDEVIRAMLNIAFPYYGAPQEIEPEVHIASDIWSELRYVLNGNDHTPPFQLGSEPMPKITVEGADDEK